ncbi:MAG: DUF3365 domain-containing protein [Runella sp.]
MEKLLLVSFLMYGFVLTSSLKALDSNDDIKKKGDEIVQVSSQTLSKAVMQAMAKGGVEHAAKFCNTAAYPLTDSLSSVYGVKIRRTSHQWRNPKNKPSKQERDLLVQFLTQQKNGQPLEAKIVQLNNNEWLYAKPILLQPQCQVCHGKLGETVTAENYKIIKKLYPSDKAVGFVPGDIRGMWVLKFSNQ